MAYKKIYNEIILVWNEETNSYDTIYEDSYSYDGPIYNMAKKGDLDVDISGDADKVISLIDDIAKSTNKAKNATKQYSRVNKNQITVLKGLSKVYQTLKEDQKKLSSEQKTAIEQAHQLEEITKRIKQLKAQEAAAQKKLNQTHKEYDKEITKGINARRQVAALNLKEHFKRETQAAKETERQIKLENAARVRASKTRKKAAEQLRNINFKLKAHGLSLKDITRGTNLASRAMRGEAKALGEIKRNMQTAIKTGELYGKQLDMLEVRNHRNAMSLSRIRSVMLMVAFAVGTAKRAFEFLTDAYMKQEKAEKMVSAVIYSTGAAAGFTSKQIYGYAASLQQLTGVGDETILTSSALLLTFKNISGEGFKRAQEHVINLTLALNQGTISEEKMKAATVSLGKALNDPIAGMTSLSKQGVTFSEVQKKQIRAFMETGDVAKAQGVILDELDSQVGGLGERFRLTTEGRIMAMEGAFSDLKEYIAQFFMPVIRSLVGMFKLLFEVMQSKHFWIVAAAFGLLALEARLAKLEIAGATTSLTLYNIAAAGAAITTNMFKVALKNLGRFLLIGIVLEVIAFAMGKLIDAFSDGTSEAEEYEQKMKEVTETMEKLSDPAAQRQQEIEDLTYALEKELKILQETDEVERWALQQQKKKEGVIYDVTEAHKHQYYIIQNIKDLQEYADKQEKRRIRQKKELKKAIDDISESQLSYAEALLKVLMLEEKIKAGDVGAMIGMDVDLAQKIDMNNLEKIVKIQSRRNALERELEELGYSLEFQKGKLVAVDKEFLRGTHALKEAAMEKYFWDVQTIEAIDEYIKKTNQKMKADLEASTLQNTKDTNRALEAQISLLELQSGYAMNEDNFLVKTGKPGSEIDIEMLQLEQSFAEKKIALEKELAIARKDGNAAAVEMAQNNILLNDELLALSKNWLTIQEELRLKEEEFAEAMASIWSTMGDLWQQFADKRLDAAKAIYDEEMALVKKSEDYKLAQKYGHQDQIDRLEKSARDKYADAVKKEHRLSQMSAIASVTFDFAKAIAKSYAKFGLLAAISAHPMLAAAAAIQIGAIMAQPVPGYATGGDFITSGPQPIMVGDNPGGRERVSITPLSSPNVNGPQGQTIVNVNVSGNVMSQDYTESQLIPQINEAVKRGEQVGEHAHLSRSFGGLTSKPLASRKHS